MRRQPGGLLEKRAVGKALIKHFNDKEQLVSATLLAAIRAGDAAATLLATNTAKASMDSLVTQFVAAAKSVLAQAEVAPQENFGFDAILAAQQEGRPTKMISVETDLGPKALPVARL